MVPSLNVNHFVSKILRENSKCNRRSWRLPDVHGVGRQIIVMDEICTLEERTRDDVEHNTAQRTHAQSCGTEPVMKYVQLWFQSVPIFTLV